MIPPPDERDWRSEPWGLDSKYAYDHFFGLDLAAAEKRIASHCELYWEDLMHMPKVCFNFYFPAFLGFVFSDASRNSDNTPGQLFTIVEHRKRDIVADEVLLKKSLEALDFVGAHQERFGATAAANGDLGERSRVARSLLVLK